MIGERVPGAVFGALVANREVTCYIWGAAEPLLALPVGQASTLRALLPWCI
jgi:hypothetical protein